jgi:hypothetical protein
MNDETKEKIKILYNNYNNLFGFLNKLEISEFHKKNSWDRLLESLMWIKEGILNEMENLTDSEKNRH